LESILGLFKSLKIWAQMAVSVKQTEGQGGLAEARDGKRILYFGAGGSGDELREWRGNR
jgi:hypothetical protein